jgi:hypothetical protein
MRGKITQLEKLWRRRSPLIGGCDGGSSKSGDFGGGSRQLRGPTARGCERCHAGCLRGGKWHGGEKGVMTATRAFYS